MINNVKALIKQLLKRLDIAVIHHSALQGLLAEIAKNTNACTDLKFLLAQPEHASKFLTLLSKSKSQLRQDLFVLSQLNFRRNGYFVEFGATNGVDLSNTYLLEKEFGWTGILAEPARCWHNDLRENRIAHIEACCLWSDSNKILKFNETDTAELSTIENYSNEDGHYKERGNGKSYDVKTISLNDLLTKYNAPREIEFLSVDTEGTEFEILKNLDFEKYTFDTICCEHNFTPNREKIFELLTKQGYRRVFETISSFDDWFVK
jgi:FkbM family methyltransferase